MPRPERPGPARPAAPKRPLLAAITAALLLAGPAAAQSDSGEQQDAAPAQASEPYTLSTVRVEGEAPAGPVTTVGTKIPSTPREIPKSVSAIGRERIEKQNLLTLEDAMRQVPGVVVERIDANRLNFYTRGFQIHKLQIDGVTTLMDDRVFLSPDLAMYQRVEVLKGPAGLLSGAGGAGGIVNLVRKRPRHVPVVSTVVSAGSWQNYRAAVDATGPLNESGSLRGRVVATYQDREFFYDLAYEDNALLYGILEYDLSADTTLAVGAHYQYIDTRQPWTLPAYSDYTLLDVSRSTYLGADWNHDRFVGAAAFAELQQALGGGWRAELAVRHGYNTYEGVQAFAWGRVDRGTNTTGLWGAKFDYQQEQTGVDAHVSGPFSLFGREHEVLLGASYEYIDFLNPNFSPNPFQVATINVFDPTADIPKPDFTRTSETTEVTRQSGLYSNLRLSLADPLTAVLGARASWWEIEIDETGAPVQRAEYDGVFTPLAGLIYDFGGHYSVYASYAETFQAQNERDTSGDVLDPLRGEQIEAGLKAALRDGALTASLALFRIRETHRAREDLSTPDTDDFVALGKVENQGLEVELSGRVLPRWHLFAGYTYTETEEPNENGNDGSAFSAIAPRHILRLWTNYRLAGDWRQWSVGAGVNAVSEFYNEFDNGKRLTQPAYTTVDLRIGYAIAPDSRVEFSVTNVFDEVYYQRISSPDSGNLYGEPRAYMLSLRTEL